MKKILLLYSVCFICQAQSQSYYKLLDKDTTSWQHFNCYLGVGYKTASAINPFDRPIAALDTITINSYLYKKIYELQLYNINYAGKQFYGYMREDTVARKVYFRETATSTEYLLYDFSLNVNDSIQLAFPNNTSDNGYYRVDSIKVKTEKCGPRKHFYLRKHINNIQPNVRYIEYIESIGATIHALYLYTSQYVNGFCQFSTSQSCKHLWPLGLACKHNKLQKQYQSCTYILAQMNGCMTPLDSCNYRNTCSGLNQNALATDISIFPNPVQEQITIKFEDGKKHSLKLELCDLTGKIMVTRNEEGSLEEIKVNLKGVTRGYYVLKAEIDGKKYSRPVMISE